MKSNLASIIILNWNGKEDTKECLLSLANLEYKDFEVILIDNASSDGSPKELEGFITENKFFYPIKFIKNNSNLGFAGGNLSALPHCRGEYVVLLNNDIVVDPKWLGYLIETASSDKKIGAVGGKSYKWDKNNPPYKKNNKYYAYQAVDPWLGYVHTLMDRSENSKADSISGCAVLIKSDVIKKVGFLEKTFFAYYEETDLFARIIRAGFLVVYEPKAEVWHQVAKSAVELSYFYLYQMTRNRAIFAIRNFDEPFFTYFKKDYCRGGLRALGSYYLKNNKDNETKSKKNAYLWVKKNYQGLQKQRKEIIASGSYNNKTSLFNEETISIIITNYNYKKYVGPAIKSAQNQTVKPQEIIVVDDGSTDDSIKEIEKYPVKLIKQKNLGVVAAKNRGFSESTGRFVLFLDADDILKPNATKEYIRKYREDRSVGFVYSGMEYFGSEKGIYKSKPFNSKELRRGNYIHNSTLIKREAFLAVDGYHTGMNEGYEDWDLYISIAEQGYLGAYVSKPLLRYRRHKGAISRNEIDQKKAIGIIYDVYNRHPRFFPKYFVLANKIYNRAYYGDDKASVFLRLLFFIFRIIHKFFTLLKLIVTGRFKEVRKKVKGELHFWGALWKNKNL